MQKVSEDLVRDFKGAMRRLASTVTIITAGNQDGRHGMAATAVSSVTTEPPTLLVCINRSASIHDPIVESERFCVNLLGCEHQHLVPAFSGAARGEARFATAGWGADGDILPCLDGALSNIRCEVRQSVAYGSHTIFIGEVTSVRLPPATAPLVYQDGGFFRIIAMEDQAAA
jgi:flavin reductase